MNASADERLVVMLEARIRDFEKNMAKAEGRGTRTYQRLRRDSGTATAQMEADMLRSTSRINQALSSVSSRIGIFGKAFVGGLVGGIGAAAFGSLTGQLSATVRGIAEVGDEAKRAGMSAKSFQEWRYVAEQNRIGIDAMVDGFKELNLRADEFIVTGGGSAAEAFKRLGYTAGDLKTKLKDPSALMLEIIGRMKGMDAAARIRISDELFGGSAGERFVELIDQGEAGLRKTIDRAHEVGRVMDEEMIAKAAELDQRWQDLAGRVQMFGKNLAVSLADIPLDAIEVRLNEIFTEAEGRSILGDTIYDELKKIGGLTDEQALSLGELRGAYLDLEDAARLASTQMASAAAQADMLGLDDLWTVLAEGSEELRRLADQFADGEITGEDFRVKMDEIRRDTKAAFDAMDAADKVNFGTAVSEIDRLGAVIDTVAARAAGLLGILRQMAGLEASSLSSGRGNGSAEMNRRLVDDNGNGTTLAPGASPRPRAAPLDIDLGYAGPAKGGSGRGGGGGGADALAQAMEQTRERIDLLHQETAAFLAAADAGGDYGDMAEYAQKKAELLFAAQKAGKQITPELTAEIDKLALAYSTAGLKAEEAAERMRKVQENGERGATAVSDIFSAALSGADAAKKAVGQLLLEIAKVQMNKAILGLGGGKSGGFFGFLGNLLSMDGGGYTGSAARSGGLDGKGGFLAMLHPQETVVDHTKGVSKAMAASRNTGGAERRVDSQKMDVTITMDPSTASIGAYVRDQAGRIVASSAPAIVGQATRATLAQMNRTKSGWG